MSTHFLGIDVETSGLHPVKDTLLEVGLVVVDSTDWSIVHRASCLAMIDGGEAGLEKLMVECHPRVLEMHDQSGLWADLCRAVVEQPDDNTRFLLARAWIEEQTRILDQFGISRMSKSPLLGSTPSFDRAFVQQDNAFAPILELLTHQHVDASSFTVVARAAGLPLPTADDDRRHRPIPDLEYSVSVIRHWAGTMAAGTGAMHFGG